MHKKIKKSPYTKFDDYFRSIWIHQKKKHDLSSQDKAWARVMNYFHNSKVDYFRLWFRPKPYRKKNMVSDNKTLAHEVIRTIDDLLLKWMKEYESSPIEERSDVCQKYINLLNKINF